MTIEIPPPRNQDVERLARVVNLLLAGDDIGAAAELAPIAGRTYSAYPRAKLPELPRAQIAPSTGAKTKNPPNRVIAQIHERDGFTCIYCSRKTIPLPILRLISVRFGADFGYHLNWKADVTHPLYWDIQTSLDHVVPVSAGGEWEAPENLATACSRCQYQKGRLSLDVLGWKLTRQRSTDWDGLTRYHRRLWEHLGHREERYQRQWIACYEAAHLES